MPRHSARLVLAPLVLATGVLASAPAADAQSIWLDRVSPGSVHLEVAKPIYESDGEDLLTANWWLTGRFPVGRKLHLVAEVPYARIGDEGDFDSSTLGNLYVGVESSPVSGGEGAWFEAGLRVPTASDGELVNLSAPFVDTDRWEAYPLGTGAWVLHTAGHWRSDVVGKVGVDLRVAPNVWFGGDLDDAELFLLYGGQVLHHGSAARVGAGITGRWLLTGTADDDMTHQVEGAADFLSGSVRPGVTFRVPLDEDLSDFQQAVVGVTLTVVLN